MSQKLYNKWDKGDWMNKSYNKLYVILVNDGLLTEEVYYYFNDAVDVCKELLGIEIKEMNTLYTIQNTEYRNTYVKIKELILV